MQYDTTQCKNILKKINSSVYNYLIRATKNPAIQNLSLVLSSKNLTP